MAKQSEESKECGRNGKPDEFSLRDRFAAQALTAIALAHSEPKDMAIIAYRMADAMIEARKTTEESKT